MAEFLRDFSVFVVTLLFFSVAARPTSSCQNDVLVDLNQVGKHNVCFLLLVDVVKDF